MPASAFVVYYSLATGRVRGWVRFNVGPNAIRETDAHLNAQLLLPLPKGVGRLSFPIAQYGDENQIQALVTAQTKLPFPPNDAFDCFDAQGSYVCTINCDPQGCGDGPPKEAATMIASVGASLGSTVINGTFTPAPVPIVTPRTTTATPG